MDRRPVSVVSSRVAACRADRSPALFLQKVDRRGRAQQLDEIGAEAAPDMEPPRRRIESLPVCAVGNVDVDEAAWHSRFPSPLLALAIRLSPCGALFFSFFYLSFFSFSFLNTHPS